jgi:ketosteroid isomerase-like protein
MGLVFLSGAFFIFIDMRKLIFILTAILCSLNGWCQQAATTDAVKQSVTTMFDAMRKGDSTLLKSVFSKDMILQSIANDKDGKAILKTESAQDFAKAIGTPHTSVYDERIVFGDVKIDGDLASVWAPYQFYFGDNFSHCGVDVFQLMKTADGWKIIYIVDTRRKDNCIQ